MRRINFLGRQIVFIFVRLYAMAIGTENLELMSPGPIDDGAAYLDCAAAIDPSIWLPAALKIAVSVDVVELKNTMVFIPTLSAASAQRRYRPGSITVSYSPAVLGPVPVFSLAIGGNGGG